MISITVTTRTYSTWISILGYTHKCLQENNIKHEKWLVGYYDEYNNFHFENPKTPKDITECLNSNKKKTMTPVYVLNPWIKNEYLFSWRKDEGDMIIKFHLMGDNHLYKSPENMNRYEPCISIELMNEKQEFIDDFLKESYDYLLNVMKFKITNEVSVWVWLTDYWCKMTPLVKRNISTIYLPEKTRTSVCNDLENFLSPETKEKYQLFGIPYHRTYCFHGLAGTGKTSFIHALASTYNKNIAFLPFDTKLNDSMMIELVTNIPEDCFLVLEDFDCLFNNGNASKPLISMSSFLNCLDGIPSKHGQIVFLTTNHYLKLDPIICRPGRIDMIVEFKEIIRSQLMFMLEKFFPNQKEKYDEFYEKIKNKNLTTCMLQHYFFQRHPDGCILQDVDKHIDEMIEIHQTQREENKKSIYM